MLSMIYGGGRAVHLPQSDSAEQNGFLPARLKSLSTHQESSAGRLREVAQGKHASWGMKRGTRRGDVKFAHGCFLPCYLYKQQVRPC